MHLVNLLTLLEHLVFLSKKRRVHAVCEVYVTRSSFCPRGLVYGLFWNT